MKYYNLEGIVQLLDIFRSPSFISNNKDERHFVEWRYIYVPALDILRDILDFIAPVCLCWMTLGYLDRLRISNSSGDSLVRVCDCEVSVRFVSVAPVGPWLLCDCTAWSVSCLAASRVAAVTDRVLVSRWVGGKLTRSRSQKMGPTAEPCYQPVVCPPAVS